MKNRAAHERVRALRSAGRRRSRHGRSGEAATEDPSTVPLGSGARQDFGHGIGRLHISADVLKLNDVTQLHVTYEMCFDVHKFSAVVIAPTGPKLDAGLVVLPDDRRFSLRGAKV